MVDKQVTTLEPRGFNVKLKYDQIYLESASTIIKEKQRGKLEHTSTALIQSSRPSM